MDTDSEFNPETQSGKRRRGFKPLIIADPGLIELEFPNHGPLKCSVQNEECGMKPFPEYLTTDEHR